MNIGPSSRTAGSEAEPTGSDRVLSVGDQVTDVSATLVRPDGTSGEIPLSELVTDRAVLLSFYTMDFSPDCVKQWCAFRDFEWFQSNPNVQVVGVSKSGPRLHRQFIDRLNLGFAMYADGDLGVSEAFGVDYRTFGLLPRSRRSCFLIDSELTIRYRWLSDHWFDPTHDVPPVGEIHEAIVEEMDDEMETFGF